MEKKSEPAHTQDEMPRERFLAKGASSLSDAELLAVLLRSGVHGTPVMLLAEDILAAHGNSLLTLSAVTPEELAKIHGMGMAKSIGLAAAFELGRRMVKLRLATQPKLTSPSMVAEYMRTLLSNSTQEEFHVFLLNTRLQLIRETRVTMGLVDRSLVHAREVFREAIKESASAIILSHNHPSGDVMPSSEDIRVTKYLIKSGEIIDINVMDHIIVATPQKLGQPAFFSFKENKILYS